MPYRMLLALGVSGVLAGCLGPTNEPISPPQFSQGLYGQLWRGCDTSGCDDAYDANEAVAIFRDAAMADLVDTATSDRIGRYEVELAPGTYTICTYSCTTIEVGADVVVRADWISGPGGGEWCDESGQCRPGE